MAVGAGVRTAVVALVAISAVLAPASAADTARRLAGHRAVYELSLDRREERSGVLEATGRLVYEFGGSPCDGYSSRFRLVTRLTNTDGKARVSDMRTTSFEEGDGRSFDFVNENLVDGRKVEDARGVARRVDGKVRVTPNQPGAKPAEPLVLPGAPRFPTEHMVALIEAAEAGRTVAEIDLFDGSENGTRVYRTTIVIGREQTGPDDTAEEPAAAIPLTAAQRRWPVQISYFDPTKTSGDATPEYQLGFVLYDNGVTRRLRLDYGDFTIAGRLSNLEAVPVPACK